RLATMMDEELHLQPVQTSDIVRSSFLIFVATLVGHLIPLVPFVWLSRTPALVVAILLSALVLFGVGVYSAVTLAGGWWQSGPRRSSPRPCSPPTARVPSGSGATSGRRCGGSPVPAAPPRWPPSSATTLTPRRHG